MEYIIYFIIAIAVGYLITLGATGGPTSLDRARDELEFTKERIKMFGAKNDRRN